MVHDQRDLRNLSFSGLEIILKTIKTPRTKKVEHSSLAEKAEGRPPGCREDNEWMQYRCGEISETFDF